MTREGFFLNTTLENEYALKIEKLIRLVKERMGVINTALSFEALLGRMMIELGIFSYISDCIPTLRGDLYHTDPKVPHRGEIM